MKEWTPAVGINRHAERLRSLTDDDLIDLLESMDPLPDADDLDPTWDEVAFDEVELLIAAADAIGERRLVRAIAPLYERAALGDVFDMMQGIRHGPEKAIAPDWAQLTAIMRPLSRHPRAGCRRWAVRELGILRDPAALAELLAALTDREPLVRTEACTSLAMVGEGMSDPTRSQIRVAIVTAIRDDPNEDVRRAAAGTLRGFTEAASK